MRYLLTEKSSQINLPAYLTTIDKRRRVDMKDLARFRSTAMLLVFLLTVMPPFCDLAAAESAPSHGTPQPLLQQNAMDQHVAVTQVAVTQSPEDGRALINATIGYANRSLEVQIHNHTLAFGSGYTVKIRRLASNKQQTVLEVIGESPDGRSSRAVIRHLVGSGETIQTGMDGVRALMAESGERDPCLGRCNSWCSHRLRYTRTDVASRVRWSDCRPRRCIPSSRR
jgi:hypothetical protein